MNALKEKLMNIEIEKSEVTVKNTHIVNKILKNSLVSIINSKSSLNRYFIFDNCLFLAISKPKTKNLSDTEKKSKINDYKIAITNFLKLKKACLIQKSVELIEITEISNSDLLEFGISEYKLLNKTETDILANIESFNKQISDIVVASGIKKDLEFLKVL